MDSAGRSWKPAPGIPWVGIFFPALLLSTLAAGALRAEVGPLAIFLGLLGLILSLTSLVAAFSPTDSSTGVKALASLAFAALALFSMVRGTTYTRPRAVKDRRGKVECFQKLDAAAEVVTRSWTRDGALPAWLPDACTAPPDMWREADGTVRLKCRQHGTVRAVGLPPRPDGPLPEPEKPEGR